MKKIFLLTILLINNNSILAFNYELFNLQTRINNYTYEMEANLADIECHYFGTNCNYGGIQTIINNLHKEFQEPKEETINTKVYALVDKRTKEQKQKDKKELGSQITLDLIKKYEKEGKYKYANHYRKLLENSKKCE